MRFVISPYKFSNVKAILLIKYSSLYNTFLLFQYFMEFCKNPNAATLWQHNATLLSWFTVPMALGLV